MNKLPTPPAEAIIFEDDKLYVCLASFPIAKGHVVVVWKEELADLHLLSQEDYRHLMDIVEMARTAMLKTLNLEKVYLIYMDEVQHVHWHLVPRYDEQGFNMLVHSPGKLHDYGLAGEIKANWS